MKQLKVLAVLSLLVALGAAALFVTDFAPRNPGSIVYIDEEGNFVDGSGSPIV